MRFKGFEKDWNITTVSNEFIFLTSNSLSRDDLNYQSGYRKNIHYGDILTKYTTVKDISDHNVPFINDNMTISGSSIKLKSGDIIIADTAEDFTVGKTIEIYNPNELEVYSGLHTIPLRPINKFSNGYLAYYFNSDNFKKRMFPLIQGIKVYSISKFALSSLVVKYPTLEEQNKIAKILISIDSRISTQMKIIDKYESLIYSIYNKLLSNETNEKLGNICEIKKGTQLNTDNFDLTGSYPVINGGINISGYTTSYNCKNMITISEGGNSCGFINYFKDEFWSGGHNYTLKKKTEFNYKYLYHYLKFKEKSIMSLRVGSGLPNIQKPALQNFSIYLPDISIQNKYACILDVILEKIKIEKGILTLYTKEKEYLLNKLFI